MKEFNKIYEKIKEFDKIVIARHIGADVDALGSTLGLKEIILNTFPDKKVSVIGAYSSKFKYLGKSFIFQHKYSHFHLIRNKVSTS